MNKLNLRHGPLMRINELGNSVATVFDLKLESCNYTSLRSNNQVALAKPKESTLGVSLEWIERHSDTCITSKNGILSSDTDTILCILPNAYICPFTFSITLNDCEVLAESHHTANVMRWISERNGYIGPNNSIIYYGPQVNAETIEVPSFVINTRWSSANYYHWIHECLPRLIIALQIFHKLPYNIQLTWIGHKKNLKSYHLDALKSLNLCISNIKFISYPCVFQNLIHLTFVDPGLVSQYQVQVLRNSFLRYMNNNSIINNKERLLILRKKESSRYLELSKNQRYLINKYKLSPTVLENLSLMQQIRLFNNSELIIAPHGAGLSNIAFSSSCSVIEIMPSDSVHPLYMQIASSANLPYTMYVVKASKKSNQKLNVSALFLDSLIEAHLMS